MSADDSSPNNKRKRTLEDDGDHRDAKKVHLGDQRLDIDDLHIDVGEKYLLLQIRKTLPVCRCCPLPPPPPRWMEIGSQQLWGEA